MVSQNKHQSATRPTQRDVALRTGVSQGTVSLALRRHPSIPAETAEAVRAVALRIGYAPDPYLAGLASYRKRVSAPTFQASLAWLSDDKEGESWKSSPESRACYKSAADHALQLGYRLENHCLRQPGMTAARMENILRARSIQGIIVAPRSRAEIAPDFDFSRFSAVTLGCAPVTQRLNFVSYNQFQGMELAFQKLAESGYRRIALIVDTESDRCAGHGWTTAFWREQQKIKTRDRLPALTGGQINFPVFRNWHGRHRPDAVIAPRTEVRGWLEEMGIGVPAGAGFLLLSVPEDDMETSGLLAQPAAIGAKAVELLCEMLHCPDRGGPACQWGVLVNAVWREGRTLRNLNMPASAAPPMALEKAACA
jgi:DNA-binding LacI/PurR family transcriptional regulator